MEITSRRESQSHEADENFGQSKVYDKIDVKMDQRRLKQREKKMREQIKECRTSAVASFSVGLCKVIFLVVAGGRWLQNA